MSDEQKQLIAFLKKKGIGKTMSKSLSADDCAIALPLFSHPNCHLTTQATLLTALLSLKKNSDEENLLIQLKKSSLHPTLSALLNLQKQKSSLFNVSLNTIRHLNLNYTDAKQNFRSIFEHQEPEENKAIFLEALRLKEETFEENTACLDLFFESVNHHPVHTNCLLDIATPYDGFTRSQLIIPFVAAVLASLQLPCILHGLNEVAPKYGQTIHQLLKAAGKTVTQSPFQAAQQIENTSVGWAYIDQSQFFPKLFELRELRKRMVKRPLLATMEKFLQPIKSREKNFLLTGYTHPPYRIKTLTFIKHLKAWDKALVLRGREGAAQLNLDRRSPFVTYLKTEDTLNTQSQYISPEDFGFTRFEKDQQDFHQPIQTALSLGIEALNNKKNDTYIAIVYHAAFLYSELMNVSREESVNLVKTAIATKKALSHWQNAL